MSTKLNLNTYYKKTSFYPNSQRKILSQTYLLIEPINFLELFSHIPLVAFLLFFFHDQSTYFKISMRMVRFTTEATFCRACSIKSAIRLYKLLFSNESALLSSSLLMFKASRFFSIYIICILFKINMMSLNEISNRPILLFHGL